MLTSLSAQFKNWIRRSNRKQIQILMVGLDGAGKRTLLTQLRPKADVQIIGFNVGLLEYKNINFTVWEVGGQDRVRPLWRHYFSDTSGIVFVLDSADPSAMSDVRAELSWLLKEQQLSAAALLVLANKQDLEGAMGAAEIAEKLKLDSVRTRSWHVQTTNAITGNGLLEGLDWLLQKIRL